MSLPSMVRFRIGRTDQIEFCGVTVQGSENQATYRLIEDIWMRGEYDLPGFIPQAGWRVIDIGANAGIYAMLAASRGAQVVAYEPGLQAYQRLCANGAKWDVECHHAAVVGEARQTARLYLHPLRDTRNTLRGPEGAASVEVPAVSIEDVLAQPCDLLKVDCEGSEFEIFANVGDGLLNARRIIVELHLEEQSSHADARSLVERLRRAGFDLELRDPYPGTPCQLLTAVRI